MKSWNTVTPPREEKQESHVTENVQNNKCQKKCRPLGSEAVPEGVVSKTSNLEMRPLWGDVEKKSPHSVNLLGIAVGIKQKEMVNKIVKWFLEHDFVVMLFHYDGVVDEWNDLEWSNRALHVSAMNQTKWWFAKRFLHPDIVSEYDYIFLWDEDLGVENFNPEKYISIVREEGLEISQDLMLVNWKYIIILLCAEGDPRCQVGRNDGSGILKSRLALCLVYGPERPDPCMLLGYEAWLLCAGKSKQLSSYFPSLLGMIIACVISSQGDRTKKVGVVDAEYITHLAVPSLGGNLDVIKELDNSLQGKNLSDSDTLTAPVEKFDNRSLVRRQSYIEMMIFQERWHKAIKQDQCWVEPFQSQEKGKTGS
ncbi:hypothetical protein MTR67_005717 [Solanum verrucosum]|uniref:Uncharacterized protein n=1 Tax=Solanum verrucosum TaxID=315347 RepID=A0AAF0PWF7_SOLVR|nr:hypothetical protein MTR67_005714 [Solanum verrucosum]WMV12332.1 hypothetical protein MTR67_005717 [Solanum verrucosum]